jgi:hypothetical protein
MHALPPPPPHGTAPGHSTTSSSVDQSAKISSVNTVWLQEILFVQSVQISWHLMTYGQVH